MSTDIEEVEAGAALQQSGVSQRVVNCLLDPAMPPEVRVRTAREGSLCFRRETELREPVASWLRAERSPALIADELDFRFGAPDLLAADADGLAERVAERTQPVLRLDQLSLLEQLGIGSMTRAQMEPLTSMRWSDYERRVLAPLRDEGLIVLDEETACWCQGSRRLVAPFAGLVAVELKLRDGWRALAQAMRYRAFASETFVALPWERITDGLVDACAMRGVGLLAVARTETYVAVDAVAGAPLDPVLHRLAQELLLSCHFGQTRSLPAGSPRGGGLLSPVPA